MQLKYTACQLHQMIISKKISCWELVDLTFNLINKQEPKLNALIHTTEELAFNMAKEVDRKISQNEELPPLAGVPIVVKDNMCTKGLLTTCGSRILANFKPPYDATAVSKLKGNYLPIVGKSNMDEFAMGSSTENSAFGPTFNPWNLAYVPGGSSGGSAAAVAGGEVSLSLGSDTGGSIRQPAAYCGVLGLCPTYGLVSRYGLVAFASSLDQIGPFANNVTDLAELLNVISGYDKLDSTSANLPPIDYSKNLQKSIKGLKIGLVEELFSEGIDPELREIIYQEVKAIEDSGAEVDTVRLPSLDYSLATYYIISSSEASSNLARYDGTRYGYRDMEKNDITSMYYYSRQKGFGEEVKRRILLGTFALSAGYYDAYYLKAQKLRTLIKNDFEKAFAKFDLLISPTAPTTAFKIGEKVDDPLSMYLADICTIPMKLAGIPALSVPCGNIDGLPVGMQIIGPAFQEERILQLAYNYEALR